MNLVFTNIMNWKLIFLPLAIPVELVSVVVTGVLTGSPSECGFGNWVFDREIGDPVGKAYQTREQAIADRDRDAK